jgi:hypothetical protein
VSAAQPDGTWAGLTHSVFLELPQKPLVDPLARLEWNALLFDKRGAGSGRRQRDPPTMSDVLRAVHGNDQDKSDREALEKAGAAALQVGNQRFRKVQQSLAGGRGPTILPLREWKVGDQEPRAAHLLSIDATSARVADGVAADLDLPIERLSDADRAYLDGLTGERKSQLEVVARAREMSRAQAYLDAISRAMFKYDEYHDRLPPAYLGASKDAPLLSWRVMILPQLGYPELFQLFRLHEPWDSPHNQVLFPFVPTLYAWEPELAAAGKTRWVAPRGPDALFLDHEGRRRPWLNEQTPLRQITFVEVKDKLAVPWTAPVDLPAGRLDAPTAVLKSRTIDFRWKSSPSFVVQADIPGYLLGQTLGHIKKIGHEQVESAFSTEPQR